MGMKICRNYIDKESLNYCEINLPKYYFVHHKSYVD